MRVQLPRAIALTDVGPRDGLQNWPVPVGLEEKRAFIRGLRAAGLPQIEATSFVHPKAVPQLADAAEVVAGTGAAGLRVLVPNRVGAERAMAAGIRHILVVVAASEAFNQRNVQMSVSRSLQNLGEIAPLVHRQGGRLTLCIATAFGCPFAGEVPLEQILAVTQIGVALGVDALNLADTIGMAHPGQVVDRVRAVQQRWPQLPLELHFHDTRGLGLANALAGLEAGVTRFDASLGGLGGCPFAPGATGNICTLDLVYMAHRLGIRTGIDLDQLKALGQWLEQTLGEPLPGHVLHVAPSMVKEEGAGCQVLA